MTMANVSDLTREARLTLERSQVWTDIASIAPGGVRGIAYHDIGQYAVVAVVAREADGSVFYQTNVLLLKKGDVEWLAPECVLYGNPRTYSELRRPVTGASGVSIGGWSALDPNGGNRKPAGCPPVLWGWVSGVVADSVAAVEVRSSLATRANQAVPDSGAFIVLVETGRDGIISYQGRTVDGRAVSLELPPREGLRPPGAAR